MQDRKRFLSLPLVPEPPHSNNPNLPPLPPNPPPGSAMTAHLAGGGSLKVKKI